MSIGDAVNGLIAYLVGGMAGSIVGFVALIGSSLVVDSVPQLPSELALGLAVIAGLYATGWTVSEVSG
jgi:hypothetical protein